MGDKEFGGTLKRSKCVVAGASGGKNLVHQVSITMESDGLM